MDTVAYNYGIHAESDRAVTRIICAAIVILAGDIAVLCHRFCSSDKENESKHNDCETQRLNSHRDKHERSNSLGRKLTGWMTLHSLKM